MKKQPIVEGMEFRNWVRSIRGRVGLTMQDLAGKLGVSLNTVKNWEMGDTLPPMRADVLVYEDVIEKIQFIANMTTLEKSERR